MKGDGAGLERTLFRGALIVLALLTFTPVITPNGVYQPKLLGMPYTLWVGIIQALLLVFLTWLGTRVRREGDE